MLQLENSAKQISVISAIIHEIRNPLQLIRANIQYLELTDITNRNKKNYDVIYREIDRVNDILKKASDGENPFLSSEGVSRVSLNALLNEIEEIFRSALSQKGTALSISITDSVDIFADCDKLKQVLINVIKNAQESIDQSQNSGNGKIEINARKKNNSALIIINDNGAGINENDLNKIGTPFFTNKAHGKGLGMSISKELLSQQNAAFSITGEKNKGACVTITLPLP